MPNLKHPTIRLTNVRSNNLKNLSLEIKKGQWLSICGLSGSGKSSLAFDTLYAEGQRRYVECLSPQTRQFIQQLDPPDADALENIPPSIAIRPAKSFSSKETVASAAELINLLSLLFSKCATAVCPKCQRPATRLTKETIAFAVSHMPEGTKAQICFQLSGDNGDTDQRATAVRQATQSGFVRAILGPPDNRRAVELENLNDAASPEEIFDHPVWIVVDRIIVGQTPDLRISESLETALYFGGGSTIVLSPSDQTSDPQTPNPQTQTALQIDERPWQRQTFGLALTCAQCEYDFAQPIPQLFQPGHRSSTADALAFELNGHAIDRWLSFNLIDAAQCLRTLELSASNAAATLTVRARLQDRLDFLCKVGLGYLRLDRSIESLSAGERQRIRLTAVLGSTLVNMLYVLDEPAIGLHQHEIDKLRQCLIQLHQRGNTLIVVDHNPELIQAAHRVIEIGPGAGTDGGNLVFDGSPQQLMEPGASLTGEYLAQRSGVACRSDQRRKPKSMMQLTGATGHNLKNIDVDFPLGCLCMITGISGSGKSSLLLDTLVGAVSDRKDKPLPETLPYTGLIGDSPIHQIVVVDQTPIGRTGRSNPVTYVKAFDDIRNAFADTVDARLHNLTPGHFSFNVNGGRCEKCNGEGVQKVDMQFLADIHITCDHCNGTRYRKEVLKARYRDKNIAEVLDLTVREAFLFFRGQPRVQTKLKALIDVGLEYIRLGQPATTLSSGEAQRLKLALYLNASNKKRALFIMDEPTTGLHMKDINRLIDCFDTLITAGHSVIAIEHNLQLIKNSDYVIDLGPGAADEGGTVVAAGTPEDIARCKDSLTGKYLKKLLV